MLVVCYFLSQEMRASLLRLQYVVLVDPPAAKEAVAHHFLAKQKDEADQDGHQEKLYDSRPG
jgi:hypothetical protein